MRTSVRLSPSDRLILLSQAAHFRARYLLGRAIRPFVSGNTSPSIAALLRRVERYDEIVANSNYDKLPPETLKHLLGVQVEQVDAKSEFRAKSFTLTDRNVGIVTTGNGIDDYALTAREIMEILDADTSIKAIVHVGARVDVVSSYLAPKYPDRTFISNDLQANLADHNRTLPQSPNWKFSPGYIIDALERGQFAPDLMVLAFTSCKMTELEFANMARLAKTARAYILLPSYLSDPSRFRMTLPKPESAKPYANCMRVMDPELPHPGFQYDYHAILEHRGFTITKSEIRRAGNPIQKGGALLIVAKR